MPVNELRKATLVARVARKWLHKRGYPRLVFDHQVENDLVQVGPMVPRVPLPDVNDIISRGLFLRIVLAVERKAGRVQMRKPRGEPDLLDRMGRHISKQLRDPVLVEAVERTSQRIVV